jgi:hypothetical protein
VSVARQVDSCCHTVVKAAAERTPTGPVCSKRKRQAASDAANFTQNGVF